MEGAVMKGKKKVIWLLLVVILASLWIIRYITLNRYFAENEAFASQPVTYRLGEEFPMGKNQIAADITANGYVVTVDSFEILSSTEARERYSLTEEEVYSEYDIDDSNSLLIVTMTVKNDGNEEDGLPLDYFSLYGLNWYAGMSYGWTLAMNQGTLYYACEAGKAGTAYLVYAFPSEFLGTDGAERFSNENVYVNFTYYPQKINVKVQ